MYLKEEKKPLRGLILIADSNLIVLCAGSEIPKKALTAGLVLGFVLWVSIYLQQPSLAPFLHGQVQRDSQPHPAPQFGLVHLQSVVMKDRLPRLVNIPGHSTTERSAIGDTTYRQRRFCTASFAAGFVWFGIVTHPVKYCFDYCTMSLLG